MACDIKNIFYNPLQLWVDIDLNQVPWNASGLSTKLNNPLYSNAPSIVAFVAIILAILGILYAIQIYQKMQIGEGNVSAMMSRWGLGLILFVACMTYLSAFVAKQDFNRKAPNFKIGNP